MEEEQEEGGRVGGGASGGGRAGGGGAGGGRRSRRKELLTHLSAQNTNTAPLFTFPVLPLPLLQEQSSNRKRPGA